MNKVTVRIWMPGESKGLLGALAASVGVGHASLSLTVNQEKYYITWMANGDPFSGLEVDPLEEAAIFGRKGTPDDWGDEEIMERFMGSRRATYKIGLKAKQPGLQGEGLDAEKIKAFWLKRLADWPKYCFLSVDKNCTGCVVGALRAGGLEQYVSGPDKWVVQDAKSLLAWCLAAEQRLGKVVKPAK